MNLWHMLFEKGQICGACFEVRCVEDLRWCIPGTSIIVTAINFCIPNYGFDPDGDGRCNSPIPTSCSRSRHLRRSPSVRRPICRFSIKNMMPERGRDLIHHGGGGLFLPVLISNLAGMGDVVAENQGFPNGVATGIRAVRRYFLGR